MVKTNQALAFVLAKKAPPVGGQSVFRRVDTLERVPEWVEAIVAERPLVLAGAGEQPEYCVTDSSVWRKLNERKAEKQFPLDSVLKAHWISRHLWRDLKEALPSHGEQRMGELKKREGNNVDVELNSGDGALLEGAGSWLLRFLERCSHYNAEMRSNSRADTRVVHRSQETFHPGKLVIAPRWGSEEGLDRSQPSPLGWAEGARAFGPEDNDSFGFGSFGAGITFPARGRLEARRGRSS